MKVIAEGVGANDAWWHGLRIACPRCGRTVEMEAGDEKLHGVHVNEHAGRVSWECEKCGAFSTIEKRGT